MRVFVVLAGIFAVASAINPAAIYRSRCSEGASYWCETAMHADECGAVDYCIQNFWKGKAVQASSICSNCEAFVNGVHNVLDKTAVQSLIIEGAKEACAVMGALESVCKTVVESVGAEALKKLVSELTGDEVCSVLGFCKALEQKNGDQEVCTLCQLGMTEINKVLSDKSVQQQIEDEIEALCPLLEQFIPNCKQTIESYFPLIMSLALEYLNAQTCTEIGLCPGAVEIEQFFKKLHELIPSKVGGDACSDCEAFFTDIQGMLNNQTVQNLIINELETLCSQLGSFSDQCKSYVDQYASLVFGLLSSYINPQQICTSLTFCPARDFTPKVMPKISLPKVTGDGCSDCEAFFKDIQDMLNNQTVQNLIINELEMLCSMLGSFSDQCKSYVDQYASLVFGLLSSYIDPQQICTQIGFCPAQIFSLKGLKLGGDMCTDCKTFVGDIDGLLQNQTVQNLIINELETLCASTGSFADQCKSYVDQYAYLVFGFIASELDPDMVCSTVGFCSSTLTPRVRQEPKAGPQMCTLCESLIASFETYLSSEANQAKLVKLLEDECSVLGPFAGQCKDLVSTYSSAVINVILSFFDPRTVCTDIKLCTASLATSLARKVPTDPNVCNDCITFFTDVDTVLSNQSLQNQILSQLEQLCSVAGSMAAECKLIVQSFGPQLFEQLIKKLQPQQVCTMLQLCNSANTPVKAVAMVAPVIQPMASLQAAKAVPQKTVRQASQFECSFCKTVVGLFVNELENNKTEEEVLNAVSELCKLLPSSEAVTCVNYVHDYGSLIIELLQQEVSPEAICEEIGVCTAELAKKAITDKALKGFKSIFTQLPQADGIFCTLCRVAADEIEVILSSNKTKGEIKKEFEQYVCGNLPSPVDQQCDSFMEIYGDVLIQLLLEQYDPATFCTTAGLCSSASLPKSPMPSSEASSDCVLCEFIVKELEDQLSKNATEYEIKAVLDRICDSLPSSLSSECLAMVDEYSVEIINYFVHQYDPQTLCTAIKLCTSDEDLVKASEPEASAECVLCEFVMSELDKVINENSTKTEIEDALKEVCNQLPVSIRQECDLLVQEYTPYIIAYLTQGLSPDQFCRTIGLCTSTTVKSKKAESGTNCAICEFVIAELDSMLAKGATQDAIRDAVEKVCSVMPSTIQTECKNFVDTYEPLLIKYLVQEEPSKICGLFQLCTASLSLKEMLGSLQCDACQIAVREFMNALQEPSVTNEIVKIVNETCIVLPADLKAQCYTLLDQYGDLVTQFIAQFFDPITTCTLIDMCPTPANNPVNTPYKLLGQNECSRGPGYWCATMDNAKKCNMVDHCNRHVWN